MQCYFFLKRDIGTSLVKSLEASFEASLVTSFIIFPPGGGGGIKQLSGQMGKQTAPG